VAVYIIVSMMHGHTNIKCKSTVLYLSNYCRSVRTVRTINSVQKHVVWLLKATTLRCHGDRAMLFQAARPMFQQNLIRVKLFVL